MEHIKTFHRQEISTSHTTLIVEGPVPSQQIAAYRFHEGLVAFRQPEEQKEALIGIASLPEGRIIIVRDGDCIVGYVTFLYPDPLERWSEGKMIDLLELGAIEIAAPYRHGGIGKEMLRTAFADDYMENYIVISTEYYWHWDLKGTGLSVWEYRKVMEKLMGSVGMQWFATDDPEITAHPANCLMARVGKNVPLDSVEQFDRLRFVNRQYY
ncbi:GNAT family N-acetyltransferase [Hazenella coriacea]|uniref:Acetoin utilization protein AcuA n=1 Tax=Hazenella coriacea TaxID=1179467 RepID=A0A4R3L5U1_9BACL|nr:GNAT family N-acetyltransferase [Hazenella coriacea]TCS95063.1 acetoin utilization protein AcuA [Hazenella coriacea]